MMYGFPGDFGLPDLIMGGLYLLLAASALASIIVLAVRGSRRS